MNVKANAEIVAEDTLAAIHWSNSLRHNDRHLEDTEYKFSSHQH